MSRWRIWASLILVLVLAIAGAWAFWNFDLRWRTKLITRHQQEIAGLLQASGWASPRLPGKKLYMIATRDCAGCARFRANEFPKLHAKGVDTRVIMIAQRDINGQSRSTPAERSTVAQIWLGRDWSLLERWYATPSANWTAAGIPPADNDMARMAVVESGRSTVDKLAPLLKDNGIKFTYPTLIWWNDKGEMRGCACTDPHMDRPVRKDLGV
jgi:hypothetical protein